MTGDTFTDEKTPPSPASPTNTDTTLRGDAFIEIADENSDCHSTISPSVRTNEVDVESAQPRTFLHATVLVPKNISATSLRAPKIANIEHRTLWDDRFWSDGSYA